MVYQLILKYDESSTKFMYLMAMAKKKKIRVLHGVHVNLQAVQLKHGNRWIKIK